jgi:hypothetical protein
MWRKGLYFVRLDGTHEMNGQTCMALAHLLQKFLRVVLAHRIATGVQCDVPRLNRKSFRDSNQRHWMTRESTNVESNLMDARRDHCWVDHLCDDLFQERWNVEIVIIV